MRDIKAEYIAALSTENWEQANAIERAAAADPAIAQQISQVNPADYKPEAEECDES